MYQVGIAGISSKLALEIARECLKRPNVKIRGSCRDIASVRSSLPPLPQLELIQCGAYDLDALRSLVKGCHVMVCCYYADNKTMVEAQKILIDLCEEFHVPRYLASDFTMDYTKLDWGDIILKDPMKEIYGYLQTRSRVKGVHVLVGLMMETFWDYFGVWDPDQRTLRYWGSEGAIWELTTYHTAAQYVAEVVCDPTASGIKKFAGQRVTIPSIAKDIEAVLNIKPVLRQAGTESDVQSQIMPSSGEQNPITAAIYYTLTGKFALGDVLDNVQYPKVKPVSFREFLRDRYRISKSEYSLG